MKSHFPTESSPSPFRDDGEEFFKVIRLKTGENILCTMSRNVTSVASESYLTLHKPVLAVLHKQMTKAESVVGELFLLRPWIGCSNSTDFVMPTDIILTMGDLTKTMKFEYLKYLEELEDAQKFIDREEDERAMNTAIYNLLTDVNPGKPIHFLNDN